MRAIVITWAALSLQGCTARDVASPLRSAAYRSATVFPGSEVIALGSFGEGYAEAHAINAAGSVVGGSVVPGQPVVHAFIWRAGVMTDLGALPDTVPAASNALGMNDVGQIVGFNLRLALGQQRAVLWQEGKIHDLGSLTGPEGSSLAYGINNAGQVVGISFGAPTYLQLRAFLWEAGAMRDLGTLPGGDRAFALAINESGEVAGGSGTATAEFHAVIWQLGSITDLGTLGGTASLATAINDAGQVAGRSNIATGVEHAFFWQNGIMQDLGTLPTPYDVSSRATGINAAGQVVGVSQGPGLASHAFLWSASDGMEDLGALVGLQTAGGINGSNVVGELQPYSRATLSSLIRLRFHQ